MQSVRGVRAAQHRREGAASSRLPQVFCLLAVLLAILIAGAALRFGKQPVFADAAEYLNLGQAILTRGLSEYGSELRTYGYPAFLAAIMLVTGREIDDIQVGVFVAQLLMMIGVAWVGARRIEGALNLGRIGPAVFAVTVVNPFLLLYTVQILTDLPAALLLYLAVVLSLPQRRPEGARTVALLAAGSLLSAGLAVMLRPAHTAVVPALAVIWAARAVVFRDVRWWAVPLALAAFALPLLPQLWSNYRIYGVVNPLIVRSLYADQAGWGLQYAKYGTLLVPGFPNTMFYDNPFLPAGELTVGAVLRERPVGYAATLALHAFALVDQDFPFAYIQDIDPWYRWPLSVLNYLFLLGAGVGLVLGLRRGDGQAGADGSRLRQRFIWLALLAPSLALVAVYLPTAVENRFSLPLYPLMTAPFVLAAVRVSRAAPTAGRARLTLGILAVVAWVGAASALSVWIQEQAGVLVMAREVKAGLRPLPRPAAEPVAPGQPTPVPVREIPSATYVVDLPRELSARRSAEFDVTVTNTGQETWNVRQPYPVNIAVRFVARSSDLQQRVKGLMRDSQPTSLPNDVPPGGSATVRVRIVAPPEAGRYTMMVHVTRIGVPDSRTNVERTVRVVDDR